MFSARPMSTRSVNWEPSEEMKPQSGSKITRSKRPHALETTTDYEP